MCEYRVNEDISKLDCPVLHYHDNELCGLLAITEALMRFEVDRDQDRMWIFILLNELWGQSSREIILHRILRHKVSGPLYPDIAQIRICRIKLSGFLRDLDEYFKENNYLNNKFGVSDSLCASIISYLDYVGEIPWQKYRELANWYSAIKARPSFAFALQERFSGIPQVLHYMEIDFLSNVGLLN
jgi:glutathione S-transferase